MYLSKLEIHGFKSFAQKTDLRFTDGLTAIVGPNGCGKTNIIDAIRWVLGEQKTSVLRSEVMEHVIFNGTRTRKPLGMSEVSLTIENNKHILPTEYSQVTITRRLFRSGDSQYLLNKTQCRLRDILDLFMDTGMGANAYSVIELKMVESILSDRAEDRRNLFEEAAGVVKYKIRRREASRKLEAVQRDLSRVHDIVREVQKIVNSLGRQADKARNYQEIAALLKEAETLLLKHDFHAANEQFQLLKTDLEARFKEKSNYESELEEKETELGELETKLAELDSQLAVAQEREQSLSRSVAQATQNLAVARERKSALERNRERLEREEREGEGFKKHLLEKIEQLDIKLDAARKQAKEAESAYLDAKQQRDAARETVTLLRNAIRPANDALLKKSEELSQLQSSRERHKVRIESLRRRVDETAHETRNLQNNLTQLAEQHVLLNSQSAEFSEKLLKSENELHSAQERQGELQHLIENLQNTLSKTRSDLSHKAASLEFLSGLVDTTESSLFLMKSGAWQPQSEKILLAEAVGADEQFRVAVEAALGDAARYFVVDTRQDALHACSALQSHGKGKATFVCRELVPELPPPAVLKTDGENFGWLSELVRTDDTLRHALRGLLGRTVIVANLEKAWDVLKGGAADVAVTLAGEVVRKSGVLRGGAVSKTEGLTVGKRERIQQLTEETTVLKAQIEELQQQFQTAKSELSTIDIRALQQKLRQAESERNQHEQKISQLEYKRDSLENSLQTQQQNIDKFLKEAFDIEEEDKASVEKIEVLKADRARAQNKLERQTEDLHHAEEELAEREQHARQTEIKFLQLQNDVKGLAAEEQRLEDQERSLTRRMENREKEVETMRHQFAEIEHEMKQTSLELERLQAGYSGVKREREEMSHESALLKEQQTVQSGAVRATRRSFENAVSMVHGLELRITELNNKIEDFKTKAAELEANLEEEFTTPENFNPQETKQQIATSKQKLASLGNVNFLALEEHSKESERFEFLKTQLNDLIESEKTLLQTITEINQTAQQRFSETFEKIQKNFSELFTMLFNGDGEAEIKLAEGDPLEATIEINARPRGKRPHSIEMLSGGEKTLTAIALLFAIYLVKPSPFCILDEVDAPLDDANIDRYLMLIRKFSENTQFLMITHNKKTMEAADTLYGVTMQEQGVSKMVSVEMATVESFVGN